MFNNPWPAPVDPGGYAQLMPSGIPPGAVITFAGEIRGDKDAPATGSTFVKPWGWLICNGDLVNIYDYPLLFQALGNRYAQKGDSDAKKFRLPDYRGYFLRMVDLGAGKDPDQGGRKLRDGSDSSAVGSYQDCALQKHQHTYCNPVTASGGNDGPAAQPDTGTINTKDIVPQDSGITLGLSDKETRPLNIYVYYLIKYN